jgi:hypothetical protein
MRWRALLVGSGFCGGGCLVLLELNQGCGVVSERPGGKEAGMRWQHEIALGG